MAFFLESITRAVPMALFISITRVEAERRLVYSALSEEVRDKSDEILDYATAKPAVEKWLNEIKEASGGKSLGNVNKSTVRLLRASSRT